MGKISNLEVLDKVDVTTEEPKTEEPVKEETKLSVIGQAAKWVVDKDEARADKKAKKAEAKAEKKAKKEEKSKEKKSIPLGVKIGAVAVGVGTVAAGALKIVSTRKTHDDEEAPFEEGSTEAPVETAENTTEIIEF